MKGPVTSKNGTVMMGFQSMNSSVTKASHSKNGTARRVGFHRAWVRPFPWHLGVVRESSDLGVDAMGSTSPSVSIFFYFFFF